MRKDNYKMYVGDTMIKIVTDSASLYSKPDAIKEGMDSAPLSVNIDDKSYRDFEEIHTMQLIQMIKQGAIPTTSQPSIGEKVDIYNEAIDQGYEVIDITMADGLSGTYHSALAAKEECNDPEKVIVYNSKTLCIPQRLMVDKANDMAKANASKEEIIKMLDNAIATEVSFLTPLDFNFLVRGGRTNNATAIVGGLLKLVPVVRKTDDGTRLNKFTVTRTYKRAVHNMIFHMKERHADASYTFGVAHAMNEDLAFLMKEMLQKEFGENIKVIITPLSPSFVTQGGPGCVSMHMIKI